MSANKDNATVNITPKEEDVKLPTSVIRSRRALCDIFKQPDNYLNLHMLQQCSVCQVHVHNVRYDMERIIHKTKRLDWKCLASTQE